MNKTFILIILFVILSFSGTGLAHSWSSVPGHAYARMEGFPGIAYQAADVLEYNLTADISRTLPIMFSSFVDLSDFNTTSVLGRMLGEQVASRFSQHGYNLVEMRLRKDSLLISPGNGELALSRNMNNIRGSWDAQAVITGTYHIVGDKAIVSVRVISTTDNSILSSHDFSFRLDRYLSAMVDPNKVTSFSRDADPKNRTVQGPLSTGAIQLNPSRSTDARLIQARLAELGLYLDRIDGIWGRNSKIALERFKAQHQLPAPDRWDMPTQLRLFQGTNQ